MKCINYLSVHMCASSQSDFNILYWAISPHLSYQENFILVQCNMHFT